MVNNEKIDEYTHILTMALCFIFIICLILLAVKIGVGYLLAISMTG